jgi:hypothetical protein
MSASAPTCQGHPAQLVEVNVQGASEEQGRRHALHQYFREIDRREEGVLASAQRREAEPVEANNRERHGQRDRHDADRHRPFQVFVI